MNIQQSGKIYWKVLHVFKKAVVGSSLPLIQLSIHIKQLSWSNDRFKVTSLQLLQKNCQTESKMWKN